MGATLNFPPKFSPDWFDAESEKTTLQAAKAPASHARCAHLSIVDELPEVQGREAAAHGLRQLRLLRRAGNPGARSHVIPGGAHRRAPLSGVMIELARAPFDSDS